MTGYNCTVFAYGQTGTGKTFTMEGGEQRGTAGVSWDSDPTSGIIPRALAQILDTLKEQSDQLEYSVKISFLELYNEEIFDLLSSVDDTSKLRLYEDAYRKGSVIIQVCINSSYLSIDTVIMYSIIYTIELQWRDAPPCSSWDTGRVALLLFSPSVKSLN